MDPTQLKRRLVRVLQAAASGALALAGLHAGNDPDTLGHLAQGRQIAQLGHIPSTDAWSLLHAGRPWLNYEWLSDLLYFGLHATFGYDGLIALKCTLLAVAAWLVVGLCARSAGPRAAALGAFAIVSAIPAMRFRLSDRPHVLGMFLGVVYVAVLARLVSPPTPASSRARAGLVALVAVLHVLWVNLHGSHLLGVLITASFAVFAPREARRTMLVVLGLEAAASCVSPWGPRILLDALRHVFDPRFRELVSEWGPWNTDDPTWLLAYPLAVSVLLVWVARPLFRAGPAARAGLAVSLILGLACVRSIRFVGESLLLSAPWIGVGLAPFVARLSSRALTGATVGFAATLAIVVPWQAARLPPHRGLGHGLARDAVPEGPGLLLARAARPPRVFAGTQHSWPLMWFAPRARFFIDGRIPFYGAEHVETAARAFQDRALFSTILRRADIDAVVLKHTLRDEQSLLADLAARPGWSLARVDDAYALYVRDDLAQASGFIRLSSIDPSYDPHWILDAEAPRCATIADDVAALRDVPTARGYVRFVEAALRLAPFARDGARGGLRVPEDTAGWASFQRADALLRAAPDLARHLPSVAALHAIVLATLCEPERAEAALARSAVFELAPSRETTLAAQEIALRRGEREAVRQLVEAGLRMPEGRGDPWLLALREATEHAPVCPP
jgi:hypothetical protein